MQELAIILILIGISLYNKHKKENVRKNEKNNKKYFETKKFESEYLEESKKKDLFYEVENDIEDIDEDELIEMKDNLKKTYNQKIDELDRFKRQLENREDIIKKMEDEVRERIKTKEDLEKTDYKSALVKGVIVSEILDKPKSIR